MKKTLTPLHPGEVLREEYLKPLGMSAGALARACGVPRTRIERITTGETGVTADTDEAFVAAMRRLMAEFQSPFVPGLPRFTGGAVGFIGYDASPTFDTSGIDGAEPVDVVSAAGGVLPAGSSKVAS